jgi:hypothetical protein
MSTPTPSPNRATELIGSGRQAVVWMVIVAGFVLGPLIALSLPDRPFELWPRSRAFSEFVAGWIPSIDALGGVSRMPQVTRVFMAGVWSLWFPLCTLLILSLKLPTEE